MRTAEIERFIAEPRPAPEERRAHPRETLFTAGLLVLDGETRACTIVDRSLGGFRLRFEGAILDRFALIDLVAGQGYEGEVVWRKGPEAGTRRLATYDLRGEPAGLGLQLQALWRTALA